MTIKEKRDLVYSFCDNNATSCNLCKLNCGGWKHQCMTYKCPDIENMDESELDSALNLIYADNKVKCVGKEEMTPEQAKYILHPETTLEALSEIEYYAGFNGKTAKLKAVDEACTVACEALDKRIPKKPIPYEKDSEEVLEEYSCPECNAPYDVLFDGKLKFCQWCGQRLEWSE